MSARIEPGAAGPPRRGPARMVVAALVGVAVLAGALAAPTRAPVAVAAGDPVIAATGDIACDPLNSNFNGGNGSSQSCRQKYTSDLVAGSALAAILLLGDNQYYCGGYQAFLQSYDKSWGRVKGITYPAVGNHEYITSSGSQRTGCNSSNTGAAGHFAYFGAAAGAPSKGYYSFDIGTWHLIMLNSSCSKAGGCSSGTQQGQWLRADLAAHSNFCTLAFWHIPLFSSGGRADSTYKTFWDALYAADADVVLNGHDHIYERFAPQSPTGARDNARGIREFVVGTGGANHTSVPSVKPNSEVRNSNTYGVLRLTLHPTSYDWQFVPETGGSFTDSGTGQCHGNQNDTQPPTQPGGLVGSAPSAGRVDLSWGASTDDVGVLGYRVFRAGTQIATVAGTSYSDLSATPGSTVTYAVAAYDAGGNQSASSSVPVTTPPDTQPPSPATGLTATTAPGRVDLTWEASTDDVGVAEYSIRRDDTEVGTSATTTFADTTVAPQTSYSYRVVARDSSGNASGPSDPVSVTTPSLPTVVTILPTDDTYARADQPGSSFGSAATVQVDGSPLKRMFLRFAVTGLAGRPVVSARLRLRATDASDQGGRFHRMPASGWTEGSLTWNNQPGFDPAVLTSLGSVTAGGTYEVDLSSVVTADGTYEFAVDSTSTNGADFASSEGAAGTEPRLVITVG